MIYGLGGVVCALLFVMTLPSATTWYLILGSCILAATAVFNVTTAIIALRQDDDATSSGSNDTVTHGADVKVMDGATYTMVKRSRPSAGQGAYGWLGDNGQEVELTDEEAARLS